MTNVSDFSSKSKGKPSVGISTYTFSVDLPPLSFTSLPELVDEPVSTASEKSSLEDDCYEPLADNKSPILISQAFLNDMV